MSHQQGSTEGLSEVARLAALLADQVLNQQILNRAVAECEIQALVEAALLLEDYGIPLPPLVMETLRRVYEGVDGVPEADGASSIKVAKDSVLGEISEADQPRQRKGLFKLFGSLRS